MYMGKINFNTESNSEISDMKKIIGKIIKTKEIDNIECKDCSDCGNREHELLRKFGRSWQQKAINLESENKRLTKMCDTFREENSRLKDFIDINF